VLVTRKGDGEQCISQPLGGFFAGPQPHIIEYLYQVVGVKNAYIDNWYGTDVVASARNCLKVDIFRTVPIKGVLMAFMVTIAFRILCMEIPSASVLAIFLVLLRGREKVMVAFIFYGNG